jgi:hypothetical protein
MIEDLRKEGSMLPLFSSLPLPSLILKERRVPLHNYV